MASLDTVMPTEPPPNAGTDFLGSRRGSVEIHVNEMNAERRTPLCAQVRARVRTGAKPPPGVRKLVVCP